MKTKEDIKRQMKSEKDRGREMTKRMLEEKRNIETIGERGRLIK